MAVAATWGAFVLNADGIRSTRTDVLIVGIASLGGALAGAAPVLYLRWLRRVFRRAEERLG